MNRRRVAGGLIGIATFGVVVQPVLPAKQMITMPPWYDQADEPAGDDIPQWPQDDRSGASGGSGSHPIPSQMIMPGQEQPWHPAPFLFAGVR